MQIGRWTMALLAVVIGGQQLIAQTPFCAQIHIDAPSLALEGGNGTASNRMYWLRELMCSNFLAMDNTSRFLYINPIVFRDRKEPLQPKYSLILVYNG
ncbi:MAG: hypothetical protein AB8E82_14820 [Aureispira sp.]